MSICVYIFYNGQVASVIKFYNRTSHSYLYVIFNREWIVYNTYMLDKTKKRSLIKTP